MGTRTGNSFYAKTPLWRRVVFALLLGILGPPLIVLLFTIPDPSGLNEIEPTSETLLIYLAVWGLLSALLFVGAVVMVEFWWRRHPPEWMATDDDDSIHEPEYRG